MHLSPLDKGISVRTHALHYTHDTLWHILYVAVQQTTMYIFSFLCLVSQNAVMVHMLHKPIMAVLKKFFLTLSAVRGKQNPTPCERDQEKYMAEFNFLFAFMLPNINLVYVLYIHILHIVMVCLGCSLLALFILLAYMFVYTLEENSKKIITH